MTVSGQFRLLSRRFHGLPSQKPCRLRRSPLRSTRHARSRRSSSSKAPELAAPATPPKPRPISAPPHPPDAKALPLPGPPTDDPIPIANNVTTLPLWQRLGPLTRAADSYARAQRSRPYFTQILSSLAIAICSDMSVQWIMIRMSVQPEPDPVTFPARVKAAEEADGDARSPPAYWSRYDAPPAYWDYYDAPRTLRSMCIAAISSIPIYRWYLFLSHNFNYSSHVLSLSAKVIVNQLVFTPVYNSYFFGMQALMGGETPREAFERICRTVPISFAQSIKLWPAATAFSFTFVSAEYRSVFSGVIAIGWQTYLVYLNRKAELLGHIRLREAAEEGALATAAA